MDLSVIIVSHGHEAMLGPCIETLCPALEGLASELILVDNLNRGGMAELARHASVPTVVRSNASPQGFAQNVNEAAASARGRYLLILNPDTRMHAGKWREAIEFLERNRSVGLLGCRLLNADGSVQQSYRQFPSVAVAALRGMAVDRWPWRPRFYRELMMEDRIAEGPMEVGWLFGACLLVARRTFDLVRGMDQKFRLYYEDVDFCYRIRQRGLAIVLFPGVALHHDHQRTSARRPFSRQWWWHAASVLRYFSKHRYVFRPSLGGSGKH